jgi:hypothetical protein
MSYIFLFAISLSCFLYSSSALAVNYYPTLERYNPFSETIDNAIDSEEKTKKEIEKIETLEPSKSPALNQDALIRARSQIDGYSFIPNQLEALKGISIPEIRKNVTTAINKILTDVKNCDKASIKQNLLAIQRLLEPFNRLGIEPFEKTLSDMDIATLTDTVQFLQIDPATMCLNYSQEKKSTESSLAQINASVDIYEKQLNIKLSSLKDQSPRADALKKAWEKYAEKLTRSIEDQSVPATKVADQLGIIIGVFCVFGILMFLSVAVFKDDVQFELIASGQVIQFATVMVLLIVVCVLGMSKFLTENTLGTLLGGIGGYVLSQGVGRAVNRAATRNAEAKDLLDQQRDRTQTEIQDFLKSVASKGVPQAEIEKFNKAINELQR